MTVTLNPVLTTTAPGTFSITLDGLMQGMAHDDPAVRYQLTGGMLDASETLPMWGGIPISEFIRPATMDNSLRATVKRATSTVNSNGISVFNQNHAMIGSVSSGVPQAAPGMLVNFYRFGSLARIGMNADPALIATLAGASITPTALNWDATNGWVTSASGTFALPTGVKILGFNAGNSMVVTYASSGVNLGATNWNRTGSAVLLLI